MNTLNPNMIYLIIEPNYNSTVWHARSIEGLKNVAAKQKYSTIQVEKIDEIPKETACVVVLGTNKSWIAETINEARLKQLKVILQGAVPSKYGEDVSGTVYGNQSAIEELVYYLYSHGRHRLALVGINPESSNDVTKYETFLSTTKSIGLDTSFKDVYYRDSDAPNSSDNFLANIDSYDGAICGNDYVAAYIINYAREHGIKLPDRLFVTGLGDSMLCKFTSPTLTSTNRSYKKSGEQIFEIWKQLNNTPSIISIVSTMKSTIIPRESTGNLPVYSSQIIKTTTQSTEITGNVESGSDTMRTIEHCLSHCDNLDMKIIAGLLNNESNEKLADKLYIAPGTVNYRLRKIYSNAKVSTKNDFVNLIRKNLSVETFIKETEI